MKRALTAMAAALATAALAGCSWVGTVVETAAGSAASRTVGSTIEGTAGTNHDADMDLAKGNTPRTGSADQGTLSGRDDQPPADFPLPIYPNSSVVTSRLLTVPEGAAYILELAFFGDMEPVVAFYADALCQQGIPDASQFAVQSGVLLGGKSETMAATITITAPAANQTGIVHIVVATK